MSTIEPSHHTLKDGRVVTIRSAEVADASSLLRHGRESLIDNDFAGREADEFVITPDEEVKLIEKHRQDAGKLWLVGEHDGSIVGTIMFSSGPTRRLAHVGHLGISLDRPWRGQGLGSLLMEKLLTWAEREPSVEKVGLAVFATNEWAIRLYRKFGFVEEGRRPREIKFGPDRYVDDVLMYRLVKQ